jgi:hypothetical protein
LALPFYYPIKIWHVALGIVEIFYGLIGMLQFGVSLDWMSLTGVITLLGYALFFMNVPNENET